MRGTAARQSFSAPEKDADILASWERFMSGDVSTTPALRDLVDQSWRRCQSADIDHRREQAPPPIQHDALHALRDECAELVEASVPVMASARDFLCETSTVMVLTNAKGTVLSLEGDRSLRGATENVHLMPGANWSEFTCGTNAIGTAIEIGEPVQIHSNEHYCSGIKRWSCSASVIRNPCNGTILGVIDVSGLSQSYSRHSLALVVATAGRIEARIAQMEMDIRYRLLEHCMDRLSSSSSDGVIVFDRHGRAIKANARVPTMIPDLGLSHASAGNDLFSLTLDWKWGKDLPDQLPPWLKREWLTPLSADGARLGAILTIPNPHKPLATRSSAVQPAIASHERKAESPILPKLIGTSAALLQAAGRARQIAPSPVPVLLLGETGVGKEVFAHGLHEASSVKSGPFVALNCGGLSRDLLTSELFGYAEGSFTGARRGGMMGKIEAANGGTLFLDEIGELPLDLQPLFLRVLEEREVCRIGETRPRKVNFRLVAATNRDLRMETQAGRFRLDLYYRLSVVSISIPALRDRAEDIPLLVDHFMTLFTHHYGLTPHHLSNDVVDLLLRHEWPGNVRELRNVIEGMLLTATGETLTTADLPPDFFALSASSPLMAEPADTVTALVSPSGLTPIEAAEREAIVRMLREHKGNLAAVARELGIAKSTLYVKLNRFQLKTVVEDMRISGV